MNNNIPWIELNLPYNSYNDKTKSFSGLGLNKPGVQIRLTNGKEYLIGDINTLAGICDDCTQFDFDEIISAYRVVFCEKEEDCYEKDETAAKTAKEIEEELEEELEKELEEELEKELEEDQYLGKKCIVLKCEAVNHLDANEGCVCSLIGKTVTLDGKYISVLCGTDSYYIKNSFKRVRLSEVELID